MARVKTFTNGGGIKPSDLNAVQDDYESAFAGFKTLLSRGGSTPAAAAAGSYYLATTNNDIVSLGASVPAKWGFYFDPADVPASPRAVQWRLRLIVGTNAVAPAVTFTAKLMKAATFGGASGSEPTLATWTEQSALTAGAAVATPAANSVTTGASSSPSTLTAGVHFFVVTTSGGAIAAGAFAGLKIQLQYRQA